MILNVESRILNVKVPRAFGSADTQLRPQAQETPYILHPKFYIFASRFCSDSLMRPTRILTSYLYE